MSDLILIIEDEPQIARLARDYLEKHGYRVLVAGDGLTGLAAARRESPGPTPPNPADFLGASRMDRVIAQLAERADIVLFDAPPVVAAADAAILGAKADGVLLVIQAGRTRRDQSERARELLEQAKVRIVGVALTNAPRESGAGYYG